jgi:predicted deacylase
MVPSGWNLPLTATGRHIGVAAIDYSDDAYAFASIPVPIAVLAGGPGPTVLLTGGTHGDEWEGQLLVRRLIRKLDPARLHGRVIALPAHNQPAVRAARRTSPIDGANLNRSFPGDPDGGPTAILAHFVEHELLARADYAVDLHSGGTATRYLPCAFLRIDSDEQRTEHKLSAAEAFGLPDTFVVAGSPETRTLSAAADRQNAVMLAAELAGAGSVDVGVLSAADAALHRLLEHWKLLDPSSNTRASGVRTRFLRPAAFVTAPVDGIFEPIAHLGDTVNRGELVGHVHRVDDIDAAPIELRAPTEGVIAIARVLPLVSAGSHTYSISTPVERAHINAAAFGEHTHESNHEEDGTSR